MKKDERLNTKAAEANIELNEKMNEDVLPTYLSNNMPAIKINQSNKRDISIITS